MNITTNPKGSYDLLEAEFGTRIAKQLTEENPGKLLVINEEIRVEYQEIEKKKKRFCGFDKSRFLIRERGREKMQERKRKIEHWHVISLYLIVYDAFTVNLAYLLALWFRYDCLQEFLQNYFNAWMQFIPIYTVICLLVFFSLKLYRSLWRFDIVNHVVNC